MTTQEDFLLEQLACLEADLDRYHRLLEALRQTTMADLELEDDIAAELSLLQDSPQWNSLRRQEAAARRMWLSFNRCLIALRKEYADRPPRPEAGAEEDPEPETGAPAQPTASSDIIEDSQPPCESSPSSRSSSSSSSRPRFSPTAPNRTP